MEVGWRVSPPLEGDGQPHLFVHRWLGGTPCWADCGFVPWSGRRAPGDVLAEGSEVSLGLAIAHGRWWVWFDGEWLGFFEASAWEGRLDVAASAQWFGEVFSPGARSGGEMGNARPGTDPDAARIDSICRIAPGTWTCGPGELLYPVSTDPERYPVRLGASGLRYGGSG